MKNTLNPNWGEEEIHCQIYGYDRHGHPNNLGGAILHIMVIKSPDREVIGTFPINLEYLFRLSHDGDVGVETKVVGGDEGNNWSQLSKNNIEESLLSAGRSHGITMHERTPNHPMITWEVNGRLLNNGQQVGIIRCSLDAWWTNDGLAHAAKSKSLMMGLASNDVRITRAIEKAAGKKRNSSWLKWKR